MGQVESLYQGRFLELVKIDGWEYVSRSNAHSVVCVIAITEEDELVFVEQFRPPVGHRVLEMPAGLVGDIAGEEEESLEEAARRELWEETGYETDQLENLGTFVTSAGMCDESVTMFLAQNCKESGPGGGVSEESIQIYRILRSEAGKWLEQRQNSGQLIDARVLTGLWLLEQQGSEKIRDQSGD